MPLTNVAGWKHWPLYAGLLALYPVLFLFSQNVGDVFESEVRLMLAAALIGAGLVFGLAYLISRNIHQAGAVTAILATAFFSFGHVYILVGNGVLLAVLYSLVALSGIIWVLIYLDSAPLQRAAPTLNIITAALVLMTLPPMVSHYWRSTMQSAEASQEGLDHPRLLNSPQHPDIYYIILDGYSSNEHFQRVYGYDNSAFTSALEQRGFYVAYESKTTYGVTLASMAASLNMRYIDDTDRIAARQSLSDKDYFRRLVADNEVARQLQARGYTYVFMMSGFILPSHTAEINIDFHPSGPVYFSASDDEVMQDVTHFYQRPFIPLFLRTTALRSLADEAEEAQDQQAALEGDEPYLFWKPERALMTWDEAEKIPAVPQATFTVIHIIKPHEPIAFDRSGSRVAYPTYGVTPRDQIYELFFEQLVFVNHRTLAMIDAIMAKSSIPPVIIIQGDHGSDLGRPESPDGRRTNFEILNAYYIPGHPECIQDPAIIPINSFRAVFNCLFGSDYAMLPTRLYAMPDDYENMFFMEQVNLAEWEAAH